MEISRAATTAINGFYYQFLHAVNLCLELLSDGDATKILCEGIEDIDQIDKDGKTCIQVKTSISKISANSKSFKKSILNFYKEYLQDNKIIFVFHTNAKPSTTVLNGERKDILELWLSQQKKGWEDEEKNEELSVSVKEIIAGYLTQISSNQNLDSFNKEFLKHVILEFNCPEDSSVYESVVKERLREKYPKADPSYRDFLFVNLVHLVIKKSIAKDIRDRYIDIQTVNEVVSRTNNSLKSAYPDLAFIDEESQKVFNLEEVILKLNTIQDNTEKILDNTCHLNGDSLMEEVVMPENKKAEYNEYSFVKKLTEAEIPPILIFNAKNYFYQTEYAIQKADIFESDNKAKQLTRLKTAVKRIYTDEYESAKIENIKSAKLLLNVNKQINQSQNNMLASTLGFAYLHNLGLMHHVANEDSEVIWVIKDEN